MSWICDAIFCNKLLNDSLDKTYILNPLASALISRGPFYNIQKRYEGL